VEREPFQSDCTSPAGDASASAGAVDVRGSGVEECRIYDLDTMLCRRFQRSGPFSLRSVWHAMWLKMRLYAWRHADCS
jgi:hypothetical protein